MDEEKFLTEQSDTNIFKQVIYKYLPFWPLFLITTSITMAIAFLKLRAETRIYVATAKVLLKDPNKGDGDSKVLDALNIFSDKKIVDNEIIVLRSGDFMQEVAKELDLFATVYNKGNVQTEELYKLNSPVKFIVLDKDSFNLSATYSFKMDWKGKHVLIDNKVVPFFFTTNSYKHVAFKNRLKHYFFSITPLAGDFIQRAIIFNAFFRKKLGNFFFPTRAGINSVPFGGIRCEV